MILVNLKIGPISARSPYLRDGSMRVTSSPIWANGVLQALLEAVCPGIKETSKGRRFGRPSMILGGSLRTIEGESTRWHWGKSSFSWL